VRANYASSGVDVNQNGIVDMAEVNHGMQQDAGLRWSTKECDH